MLRQIALASALALAVAAPATAAEFEMLSLDADGMLVVDTGKVSRNGDIVALTSILVLGEPGVFKGKYVESIEHSLEFDCKANKLRLTRTVFRDDEGAMVGASADASDWSNANTDTPSADLLTYACTGKGLKDGHISATLPELKRAFFEQLSSGALN